MDFDKAYKQPDDQQDDQSYYITIRKLFEQTFPNVLFNCLIEQKNNIMTDDGCIHFKNPITGTIYSFNYLKNKFIQPNKHSQTYLNEMLF